MNFTNQLIYRTSLLKNEKNKSILIKSFFKSNFYYNYNQDSYYMKNENVHQFLFLVKKNPEILLYAIPEFKKSMYFTSKSEKFLKMAFRKSLDVKRNSFHEEQIYYFYALTLLDEELPKHLVKI